MDVKTMLNNLEVSAVASDVEFNIIYANKRGERAFKKKFPDFAVGMNMAGCHKPETMEKLKEMYQSFSEKKSTVSHYVMDTPGGKLTVVQVPFFDEDKFAGVLEFLFEGSLT